MQALRFVFVQFSSSLLFPHINKNSCNILGRFQCETAKMYCLAEIFLRHLCVEVKKKNLLMTSLFFFLLSPEGYPYSFTYCNKNNYIKPPNSNSSIVISRFCCYKPNTLRSFSVLCGHCWSFFLIMSLNAKCMRIFQYQNQKIGYLIFCHVRKLLFHLENLGHSF